MSAQVIPFPGSRPAVPPANMAACLASMRADVARARARWRGEPEPESCPGCGEAAGWCTCGQEEDQ